MLKLTARQQQILDLIRQAIENTGFPPTRAEIAAELGFRSANAAEEHLQALARKGAIDIAPGTSRGIRLRNMGVLPGTGPAAISDTIKEHSARSAPSSPALPVAALAAPHLLALPLVGRVAAGAPILAQEHVETTFNVDPSLFSAKPDYLLKVRGLSMKDIGILEGDLLAVKKVDSARNGQIVVARIGEEVTVKRYQRSGNVIELLPENPDFKPIRVAADSEEFALEGLAVGLLRSWH
ncbi:transcriptional repressor LexA [Massilia sp. W12]|uniref:transcriptional repressor LexA n=1 Tax=Massilia sp. W12 TaxID=3126507 RepID=UPI0030CE66D1